MKTKIIIHTHISLDGGISGFNEEDLFHYYTVADRLKADSVLFGSNTIQKAAETYPPESAKDFMKPERIENDPRPLWIIADSGGKLRNLHVFRNTDYCRDIVVLISASTPDSYIKYLKERHYDFIQTGEERADYEKAFEILYEKYGCRITRTDSGGILTNILLEKKLADEISLVISPCLVGTDVPGMFRSLNLPAKTELELLQNEALEGGVLAVRYKIKK